MRTRGLLTTNRPEDLPYAMWRGSLAGSIEIFNRAIARLWLSLPFVRRSRRLGISTRRMLIIYALINWWAVAVIEATLTVALPT